MNGTKAAAARAKRRTAARYVGAFTDGASGPLGEADLPRPNAFPSPRSGGLNSFEVAGLKRIGSIPSLARFGRLDRIVAISFRPEREAIRAAGQPRGIFMPGLPMSLR